jgi:hypothetical protein
MWPDTLIGLGGGRPEAVVAPVAAGRRPVHDGGVAPLQLWRPGHQGRSVPLSCRIYPLQGGPVLLQDRRARGQRLFSKRNVGYGTRPYMLELIYCLLKIFEDNECNPFYHRALLNLFRSLISIFALKHISSLEL